MSIRTNDTRWLQPALSVIAGTDPDLFRQVQATDWTVTVVDAPGDLDKLRERVPFGTYAMIMSGLAHANAITVVNTPEVPPVLRGKTWINRANVNHDAEGNHVDTVRYLAYILAHEFAHKQGEYTEPPAYAAGRAFAVKMGDPAIVQMSDEVLARVEAREQPVPRQRTARSFYEEQLEELLKEMIRGGDGR